MKVSSPLTLQKEKKNIKDIQIIFGAQFGPNAPDSGSITNIKYKYTAFWNKDDLLNMCEKIRKF